VKTQFAVHNNNNNYINACLKNSRHRQIKHPLALRKLRIIAVDLGRTGEDGVEDGRRKN
jgi:hypothetical protein